MQTFREFVHRILISPKDMFDPLPNECLRKTQYLNRHEVEKAAQRHSMKSYLCWNCKYYHLSSKK